MSLIARPETLRQPQAADAEVAPAFDTVNDNTPPSIAAIAAASWPAEMPIAGHADRALGGALKRAFDFTVAAGLLVFLAPLFLLIAIVIKLESPGPVLFRQDRGGFGGKPFRVFKFRTMTVQEEGADVRQATRDDRRITRFGAFLRKTSLDEVVQIVNVLRGEMSLVGPRPHALVHDRQFAMVDPRYPQRQIARPGITGLAQVSGCRGPTETAEAIRARTSYDLRYVGGWTMVGDIKILLRTVKIVFRDDKAF